ncbi:hypothetical protein P7C70_g5933, partial [Phenoliferia sp. Uapishka_3]
MESHYLGTHSEQREASEGSFIEEVDLAHLTTRKTHSPPPTNYYGSVYGGVANSDNDDLRLDDDYNDYNNDNTTNYNQQHRGYNSQPNRPTHDRTNPFPPPPTSIKSSQSSLHPTATNGDGNGLPAFSRWSPTWISGGYSGDGHAYTNHPPTTLGRAQGSKPAKIHQYEEEDEEREDVEETGGWVPDPAFVGEWEAPGGEYRHGVGYDSHSHKPRSDDPNQTRKIAERLRRLEKEFGVKGGEKAKGAKEGPASFKETMEKVREDRKRLGAGKGEGEGKSGVDGKGRLVVEGPKKRKALRWFQGLGAVGVALGSIGASLVSLYLSSFFSIPLTKAHSKQHLPVNTVHPPNVNSSTLQINAPLPPLRPPLL